MTALAKFALLAVVFVDLLRQGLVFPIINTLMMDPERSFLPVSTPEAARHFNYGLAIGIFFLSWFLGVAYISRISDSIGRKNATMICLFGALAGYAIIIDWLFAESLWLLALGRAMTGLPPVTNPLRRPRWSVQVETTPKRYETWESLSRASAPVTSEVRSSAGSCRTRASWAMSRVSDCLSTVR